MSCNTQMFNSRSDYDKHMLQMFHSPVWVQDVNTRSQFDLNLQNEFVTNKNRFIPEFSQDFVSRNNGGQKPWNSFSNVMVQENYPGNALCNTQRSLFDINMHHTFNTLPKRDNHTPPWSNFSNLQQGGPASSLC